MEEAGLGATWIGDSLRHLADGDQGSEAFKSFAHITAYFTLAYKGHPDCEAFVKSEKSTEKIKPTGIASVDKRNLTWLIRRCDSYADKLSASVLHSGSVGTLAQTYRKALKLLEILGFRETPLPSLEKSSRALVSSFAMSVLTGMNWGDSIGNQSQEVRGCSPGLITFAVACLRQPMAKKFFMKGGSTMNPEYTARATQLIMRASSLKRDGPDYSFERNFLLAPLLTPQMGVVQWRLKTKKGRDALKAIETKAGKLPYDLTEESEIISNMLPCDTSEEEESCDDGGDDRGDEGDLQGGDQGAFGDGRAVKGEDNGSLGGAKAKGKGGKQKQHVASAATLSGDREDDSLKARGQTEAEKAAKELYAQLKQDSEAEILRKVVNVMEGANLTTAREVVSCPERTVVEVERSKEYCSSESLRKRQNKRTRSPTPVKNSESNWSQRGKGSPKNSDLPFYQEDIHLDWSYSRIKEAQRSTPGVCRRLPGECKPWIGKDGRFRTCKFAHPWLAK